MLSFWPDKLNHSPLKKGTSPRIDCRTLFPTEHHAETMPHKEHELSRRDQFSEHARRSTRDIMLHGAPLPLIWVLVLDNVIPDYAIPLSEAYGGPQFIARAFLEGQYCIGKAGTGLPHGALITYGARQLTVKRYEVLCFAIQMRWNISEECKYVQQSSFVVSNTASRSHSSVHGSRTKVPASMLFDGDILRVVQHDGALNTSAEKSRGSSIDSRPPLSPMSRHLIEEMCASEAKVAKMNSQPSQSIPKPILATHQSDATSQSFHNRSAIQALHSPISSSPAKLSPTLSPGAAPVRGYKSNVLTAEPHRNLTINDGRAPHGQRQPHRRAPLSPMLSARLTDSLRVDTTFEQDDGIRTQDVPLATNPHVSQCLSPITHFSLPEPFSDSEDSTPTLASPVKQPRHIGLTIKHNHQGVENEGFSGRSTNFKPSSVPRVSSPLTGGRQSAGPSQPGARNRRSSYHAEYTNDDRSYSDTDIGSLPKETRVTLTPRHAQENQSERALNRTWAATGSHEFKPHAPPALRDLSDQMSSVRTTGRPVEQSPANVRKEIVDGGVSSTTSVADRNRTTQNVRDGRGHNNPVVSGLRPSLVAVASSEFSTRSPHQPTDKSAHLPLPSPSVSVPLIIVSPTIERRQLPESPRTQRKPLGVSVENQFSSKGAERKMSSNGGRTIASTLGAAAVVAAVALGSADDYSSDSSSANMAPREEDNHKATTTRSSDSARGATSTAVIEDKEKDREQLLSATMRTGKLGMIGNGRLGHPTQARPVVRMSREAQLENTLPGSLAQGKDGRPLRTMQPVFEHDEVRETAHAYMSTDDGRVRPNEKSVAGSSREDMAQVRTSQTDSILSDATVVGSVSQEARSRLETDVPNRSSTLCEVDDSATRTGKGFYPQVGIKTKMADVQPPHRLAPKLAPFCSTKLSQAENDTKLGASRKATVTNPVYVTGPAQPSNVGYRPTKNHEAGRRAGAADPDNSWKEATQTTAPNARQPYRIPLSEYLQAEGDGNGFSEERNENRLGQPQETRRRGAVGESETTRDTYTSKEHARVAEVVASKDSSKVTPKKEDSVGSAVSAVLAAACVAAVAYEAISESHHKERAEHAEVKVDSCDDKVARDRDCLVVRERAEIVEGDETSTVEKNAVNVCHNVAFVDSSVVTGRTAASTSTAVLHGDAQIDVDLTGEQGSQSKTSQNKCVPLIPDSCALDGRTSVCVTAQTEQSVVGKVAVSTQLTLSAEGRGACDVSSDQVPVELGCVVQFSEQARKENDVEERMIYSAPLLSGSRDEQKDAFDANDQDVVARTNDRSIKCEGRTKEQSTIIQECETVCEVEQRSLEQSRSTPACTVVLSPQVNVTVQQTIESVTVASNDTVQSTECASESQCQQEQRTGCLSNCSEAETSSTNVSRKTFEACVAENLSTQTVEDAVCKTDVQDVETCELTTYMTSSETSWDGRTSSRQNGVAQVSDNVTSASVARKEQCIESSRVALLTGNTSESIWSLDTDESFEDCKANEESSYQLSTTVTTTSAEYQSTSQSANEVHDVVAKDVCADDAQVSYHSEEVHSSETTFDVKRVEATCNSEESGHLTPASLSAPPACRVPGFPPSTIQDQVAQSVDHIRTVINGDTLVIREDSHIEKHMSQELSEHVQIAQEHSLSQVTSDQQAVAVIETHDGAVSLTAITDQVSSGKAIVQRDVETQGGNNTLTISRADCAVSSVESASAIVALTACETLVAGNTTPTETRRQQAKSAYREDARTQEYDIRRQGIVSENETTSFTTSYSDLTTSTSGISATPASPRQRSSLTGREQQLERPDQPTLEQCENAQIQSVSRVGLESSPESDCQTSSRTGRTSMTQRSTPVASEASPTQTTDDAITSPHLCVKGYPVESIPSPRHSTGFPNPWRLPRSGSIDESPAQDISGSLLTDSRSVIHTETLGGVSGCLQENLSSPILCDSPTGYPHTRKANTLIHEMHESATEDAQLREDIFERSAATESQSSPIKRDGHGAHVDVHPELRVADSPESSLSASPLTPTAESQPSVGKRQFMESRVTSSDPEKRTRVNYEWQDTWISDNKEPPPSYQDAMSDYDKSPILSSDTLPSGGHKPSRQNNQLLGVEGATVVDTTNRFQSQTREGASVLEVRRVFCDANANDSALSEPVSIVGEDVDETHSQISVNVINKTSSSVTAIQTLEERTAEGVLVAEGPDQQEGADRIPIEWEQKQTVYTSSSEHAGGTLVINRLDLNPPCNSEAKENYTRTSKSSSACSESAVWDATELNEATLRRAEQAEVACDVKCPGASSPEAVISSGLEEAMVAVGMSCVALAQDAAPLRRETSGNMNATEKCPTTISIPNGKCLPSPTCNTDGSDAAAVKFSDSQWRSSPVATTLNSLEASTGYETQGKSSSSEHVSLCVDKRASLALEVGECVEKGSLPSCVEEDSDPANVATTSTELSHVESSIELSVQSPGCASGQEATGNFRVSATESSSTTWTTNANGYGLKISRHRVPSLDYMEEFRREWVGVDLYDLAECGVLYRCLSRPLILHTRVMEYWRNLTEEEMEAPEGLGSVVAYYYAPLDEVSIFTFAMMRWRLDVLGASRWPSILLGWSRQVFVRQMSLASRVAHIVDYRLFFNDRPWTVVRTNLSLTLPKPIVMMIASTARRPFDDEALAAHILNYIDCSLPAPQNLGLLCIVPLKTRETVAALNETLFTVVDILRHHRIEVKRVSSDELDLGFWVKVTVQNSLTRYMECKEEHAIEQDDVQGRTNTLVVVSGAKTNVSSEGLAGIIRRWF